MKTVGDAGDLWVEADPREPSTISLAVKFAVVAVNMILYISVMSFAFLPGIKGACLNIIDGCADETAPFGEIQSDARFQDNAIGYHGLQ